MTLSRPLGKSVWVGSCKFLACNMILTGSLMMAIHVSAQTPVTVGEQFQINSYSTGSRRSAAVSSLPNKEFLVVWQSEGSAGGDVDETSIQVRRIDAKGNLLSGEHQVNTTILDRQNSPRVASNSLGDSIVVWTSADGGGGGAFGISSGIWGRRVQSDGTPIGPEFLVNTYTTHYQWTPEIVYQQSSDQFLVVWNSFLSASDDSWSAQGQFLGASGIKIGEQFQINSHTTGSQTFSDVAEDPDGGLRVVMNGVDPTGTSRPWLRRLSPDGVLEPSFTSLDLPQGVSSLAVNESGDFVVAWAQDEAESREGFDTDFEVSARRFLADGTPQGPVFPVHVPTPLDQTSPHIVYGPDDDFVIFWRSEEEGPGLFTHGLLRGQRFASDGSVLGQAFSVDDEQGYGRFIASTAPIKEDEMLVVWGPVVDSKSTVSGRRLALPMFSDGFESGDLSAWSATRP